MDKGRIFETLIHLARKRDMQVKFAPLCTVCGSIKGKKIGIANDIDIDKINFTLAHELAHLYLHYDKGNIMNSSSQDYEEQADRAAVMLLDLASLDGISDLQKGGVMV